MIIVKNNKLTQIFYNGVDLTEVWYQIGDKKERVFYREAATISEVNYIWNPLQTTGETSDTLAFKVKIDDYTFDYDSSQINTIKEGYRYSITYEADSLIDTCLMTTSNDVCHLTCNEANTEVAKRKLGSVKVNIVIFNSSSNAIGTYSESKDIYLYGIPYSISVQIDGSTVTDSYTALNNSGNIPITAFISTDIGDATTVNVLNYPMTVSVEDLDWISVQDGNLVITANNSTSTRSAKVTLSYTLNDLLITKDITIILNVTHTTPIINSYTVDEIPAKGGSVSTCKVTYTLDGEEGSIDVTFEEVSANSLEDKVTDGPTLIDSRDITITVNGVTSEPKTIDVYQQLNKATPNRTKTKDGYSETVDVYGTPVVTLEYDDITYTGGSVSPTYSATQSHDRIINTYSDTYLEQYTYTSEYPTTATTTGGTLLSSSSESGYPIDETDGFTWTFSGDCDSNGVVSTTSTNNTSSAVDIGSVTASATRNEKTGSKTVTVRQGIKSEWIIKATISSELTSYFNALRLINASNGNTATEGTIGTDGLLAVTGTYASGSTIQVYAEPIETYNFTGWYDANDNTQLGINAIYEISSLSSNVELYATATEKSYTYTYEYPNTSNCTFTTSTSGSIVNVTVNNGAQVGVLTYKKYEGIDTPVKYGSVEYKYIDKYGYSTSSNASYESLYAGSTYDFNSAGSNTFTVPADGNTYYIYGLYANEVIHLAEVGTGYTYVNEGSSGSGGSTGGNTDTEGESTETTLTATGVDITVSAGAEGTISTCDVRMSDGVTVGGTFSPVTVTSKENNLSGVTTVAANVPVTCEYNGTTYYTTINIYLEANTVTHHSGLYLAEHTEDVDVWYTPDVSITFSEDIPASGGTIYPSYSASQIYIKGYYTISAEYREYDEWTSGTQENIQITGGERSEDYEVYSGYPVYETDGFTWKFNGGGTNGSVTAEANTEARRIPASTVTAYATKHEKTGYASATAYQEAGSGVSSGEVSISGDIKEGYIITNTTSSKVTVNLEYTLVGGDADTTSVLVPANSTYGPIGTDEWTYCGIESWS